MARRLRSTTDRALQEVVAELLCRDIDPLEPSASLRARVLAAADPSTRFEGLADRLARLFDLSPAAARGVLAAIGNADAAWVRSPDSDIRFMNVAAGPRVANAHCGLLEIAPGARIPLHEHPATEWSFGIQGIVRESSGDLLRPGDLVCREKGSSHDLHSIGDEPCVCAVVLSAEAKETDAEPGEEA